MPPDPHHWATFRQAAAADPDAAERGRRLAAAEVARNPEARKRVEDAFGAEFAAQMYPEAYQRTVRQRIAGVLDRVRSSIPW